MFEVGGRQGAPYPHSPLPLYIPALLSPAPSDTWPGPNDQREVCVARPYEIVYIFDSALEEQQVNEHLERLHELLKSAERPDPVTNVNHWGKRTLAYPIKGKDVGYYVVVNFEAEQSQLPEFERAIKLNDAVVRYLLVLIEGEQPRAATPDQDEDSDDEQPDQKKEAS